MESFNHKNQSYLLKNLDDDKGIVMAYANVYNNKDSDGDISAPGSFTRSVNNGFKRIRVLKNHDPKIMIGVPLEIKTDDPYGLLTTTQFNMKKSESKDMFTDIKLMHESGMNAELSIGYQVVKRDKKYKEIITEYKLLEYSFLTFLAANKLSTVQNIKGVSVDIIEIIKKSYNLDYSDDRLKQIEVILKALANNDSGNDPTQNYDSLINTINTFSKNIRDGK